MTNSNFDFRDSNKVVHRKARGSGLTLIVNLVAHLGTDTCELEVIDKPVNRR